MFGEGTPRINLGGRSTDSRKKRKEIVQQAKQQRADREDHKSRVKAVIVLQSCWRRRCAREQRRVEAGNRFDRDVKHVVEQIKSVGTSSRVLDVLGLAAAARDWRKVAVGIKLCVVMNSCGGEQERGNWIRVWTSVWRCGIAEIERLVSGEQMIAVLKAFLWFLDVEKWGMSQVWVVDAHAVVLDRIVSNLGFFAQMKRTIIEFSKNKEHGVSVIALASALCLKTIKYFSSSLKVSNDYSAQVELKAQKIIRVCGIFTQEILSVPVLVSRWNSWGMNSIIDNLTNTETWEWILESSLKFDFKFPTSKDRHCVVPSQIIGGDARTIGEYPPIGCLVANLLDLSYKSSFVRMSSKFISAMSILLKRADEMIFPNLSVSNDDDEEDDDNEYDEKEMYISKKINQVDDEISLQLNIFGDEKFIEILSNSLFDSEDTNLSFIVSSLLHSLFIKWPSISDKILNNLVLGTQIIRHMWFSLVKSKQLESLFTSVVNIPESVLISFSLFCQSYSFFLSIADDKSLHDGSRGFGVEDQLSIIAFLKRFLFEYCWNRIEDSKRLDREYRIIQFASQTFKNLHERDSRWQFVPIDSWTMKKISLSTFEVEFSRRISRSINLMETMPFVIPFAQRVKLFYDLIVKDQESIDDFSFRSLQSFKIRRSHLVEDAFEQMYSLRSGFKDRVKIEFISEQGFVEAGIDGGGLFKEFLTSLGSIAFSPEFGIFKETDEHFLYPNPLSSQIRYDHLSFFTFLGMIVGKALYENIIIEPRFANFFLRKMLGKENYADDLVSYDPVLYKNLMSVKDFSGKELADLHLNFMITTEDNKNIELISKGSNISVNDENKLLFIREVANFKLNRQVSNQSHAFLNGLSSIIDRSWIKMFSAPELQLLISGSTSIDIQDWANHTTYTAGYHEHSPQVIWFWEIVRESSEEDRKSILKFCTSCSRAPLLGFKAMNPNFAIQKISGSIDSLPTTATCVNLLKLPEYPSKSTMSAKLLYAARSNSGFELT